MQSIRAPWTDLWISCPSLKWMSIGIERLRMYRSILQVGWSHWRAGMGWWTKLWMWSQTNERRWYCFVCTTKWFYFKNNSFVNTNIQAPSYSKLLNTLLAMLKKALELMVSPELLPELNFHLHLIFVINNVWGKYPKIQPLNPANISMSHARLITCITPVFKLIFIRSIVSSCLSHFRAKYKIKISMTR